MDKEEESRDGDSLSGKEWGGEKLSMGGMMRI